MQNPSIWLSILAVGCFFLGAASQRANNKEYYLATLREEADRWEYYIKSANTDLSRMYYMGRGDTVNFLLNLWRNK